ncbi:MAG: Unknown protein [uncultured Sulfurovum sp.]|uniref:Uncharacterized protein n=1 Tax=uncultured Sulfurovum sp. TaxID=269237 RepID=A0A6S6T756_9BACT|nr:MAG: Unknown protein [uncultured Sulfurovum sp.]
MKKTINLVILLLLLPLLLNAQNYEDKFYKDKFHIPKGFGVHTDLGYGSYLVELHSSEVDSAIDYDVLEFTLGSSYVRGKWLWGAYGKFLVDELQSNMYVVTNNSPLNDHANIDKNEFGVYVNYTLNQSDKESWKLNFIYRYASLDAMDSYRSFYDYGSKFKYETNGLALSLVYARAFNKQHSWFAQAGAVYSKARVDMAEYIDNNPQDSFVDDASSSLGAKFGMGYNYNVNKNLFINVRADAWRHDFDKLKVTSRVGDSLPKATLKEQSLTTYGGLTWRF